MNSTSRLRFGWLPICVLCWTGVATADNQPGVNRATHGSLRSASLPPLVPLEVFFSDATNSWEHKVSPDGTKLLWLALHNDKPAVHFS